MSDPAWDEDHPAGRWRSLDTADLMRRDDCNLNVLWLHSGGGQEGIGPQEIEAIVGDIMADLQLALREAAKLTSAFHEGGAWGGPMTQGAL